ncbi:MAG: hypothetical protein ABI843_04950 [Dokdonella sp.]
MCIVGVELVAQLLALEKIVVDTRIGQREFAMSKTSSDDAAETKTVVEVDRFVVAASRADPKSKKYFSAV